MPCTNVFGSNSYQRPYSNLLIALVGQRFAIHRMELWHPRHLEARAAILLLELIDNSGLTRTGTAKDWDDHMRSRTVDWLPNDHNGGISGS